MNALRKLAVGIFCDHFMSQVLIKTTEILEIRGLRKTAQGHERRLAEITVATATQDSYLTRQAELSNPLGMGITDPSVWDTKVKEAALEIAKEIVDTWQKEVAV